MRMTFLSWVMAILLLPAVSTCRAQSPQTPFMLEKAATIAYYPSLRKLAVRLSGCRGDRHGEGGRRRGATQGRCPAGGEGKLPLSPKGGQVVLDLPARPTAPTRYIFPCLGGGPTAVKRFKHKNYPGWAMSWGRQRRLSALPAGQGRRPSAEVVLRTYIMNGLRTVDSVKSQGKEILAAPIRLRVETAAGEQDWRFAGGQWTACEPCQAVYEAAAAAPAVEVRTRSALEYDGCMKVEMDLLPGKQPEAIRRMWLEIPLRDEEAPLFHYCAMDGMRRNYAGKTPRGGKIVWGPQPAQGWLPPLWKAEPGSDDGVLWTCRDIRPNQANIIPTDFVPYIWLGGGERGLAFFAANDKGYLLDPKGCGADP